LAELDVGPVEELPPGSVKIVIAGSISIGVYNLSGEFFARDRCSHDDGRLRGFRSPRRGTRSVRDTARTSTSAAAGL
jgi:nitrite reductase/ring-hydroxylating ferredoxin subunit